MILIVVQMYVLYNMKIEKKRYILHPRGINIGDTIISSTEAPILIRNALPLSAV